MNDSAYDLVVIGTGPAGQKGAIAAAKLGKRVAVVDRKEMVGGVCLHTGTIPSKTLREAILYLTGFRLRSFYGRDYSLKEDISVADLAFRVRTVLEREMEVVRAQLKRNGVEVLPGTARFRDPHTVEVLDGEGHSQLVRAQHFLIACGTRPASSADVPLDGRRIIDSNQLLMLEQIPKDLIVVGAGVIGLEYASMFLALDTQVTVIDQRDELLDFVDRELIDAFASAMRKRGAIFRLGEKVASVGIDEQGRVHAALESGKDVRGEVLLYCAGRMGNADQLGLEALDLPLGKRGQLATDECYRTRIPHIYAAGDVIGFPALASTSMEQGRLASCHIFGRPANARPDLFPFGVYTIPEMSWVGRNERELTTAKVPYEVGVARFEELAKGQMLGVDEGMLKILFDPKSLSVLGVHAFGEGATEIVHIGQAVMALGGTIEYFRDTVFNYPTFAEAYKVAGLDGTNKL